MHIHPPSHCPSQAYSSTNERIGPFDKIAVDYGYRVLAGGGAEEDRGVLRAMIDKAEAQGWVYLSPPSLNYIYPPQLYILSLVSTPLYVPSHMYPLICTPTYVLNHMHPLICTQ